MGTALLAVLLSLAGAATAAASPVLVLQAGRVQVRDDASLASLRSALDAYGGFTSSTRKLQLGAVIDNADAMAASGQLTPQRLAPVFATLDANTQWWTDGPLLAPGQRVSLDASQVI